jgi:hypothetical protein
MASSIISTTIDETYPVAGQDNDSQGFRDNFTIIKDNFAYAKSEIEDLQNTTAKLDEDNAYDYNTQSQLNLKQYTVQLYEASSAVDVDYTFNNGHFVKFNAQGDLTLNITDWPTDTQYAEIVLSLSGNGAAAHVVTLSSDWTAPGNSQLLTDGNAAFGGGADITVSTVTTTAKLVKAFTYDSGANVFLQYLGQFAEV